MQERLRKAFRLFSAQFLWSMLVAMTATQAWSAQDCTSHVQSYTPDQWSGVSFNMRAGPLQAQLEKLMQQHLQVQSVVWLAATEYQWPSCYQLLAEDWDSLLERLLAPYQLRVYLYANHIAVVDYMPQWRGAR